MIVSITCRITLEVLFWSKGFEIWEQRDLRSRLWKCDNQETYDETWYPGNQERERDSGDIMNRLQDSGFFIFISKPRNLWSHLSENSPIFPIFNPGCMWSCAGDYYGSNVRLLQDAGAVQFGTIFIQNSSSTGSTNRQFSIQLDFKFNIFNTS